MHQIILICARTEKQQEGGKKRFRNERKKTHKHEKGEYFGSLDGEKE